MNGPESILYLPEVALEKIFSFLSYDEISQNRLVCRKFNDICGKMLSRGFIQLEKRHAAIYKRVKSVLPRRESERKAHPLARHCEILQAVDTRISMLNMTYMKYIEKNLLCFIPGKVLDEMKMVLCLVENEVTPPRTHQLLQELRDLSSMAMEHFDEHILPRVKEQMVQRILTYEESPAKAPRLMFTQALTNELHKVKKQSKTQKQNITYLAQNTLELFKKLRRQNFRLEAQSAKIREQERKIQEQNTKIQEQEATLADIKKHIDEWDQKYADLTTELVRARDDILLKTGIVQKATPAFQPTVDLNVSPPKVYKSIIKPRVTHILPKNYILNEFERKRKSNLLPEIPVKLTRCEGGCGEKEKSSSHHLSSKDLSPNIPDIIDFKDKSSNDNYSSENKISLFGKKDNKLSSLISTSIESLLKHPLSSIKSRKRKMPEDIDLK